MINLLEPIAGILTAISLTAGLSLPGALADELDQVVTADEAIVPLGTAHEMGSGHADLGAMILEDHPQLLIRDDAENPPVWWHLDDVVFTVGESSRNARPEGEDYDFIGTQPGKDIWLIPQTQIPDVPWLGWNTQSPSLIDSGARGMRLTLEGHEGPGEFSLFVQSGGFDKPTVLMSTQDGIDDQDGVWAEINTHVHANWIFTEPGVHLIRLGITLDGTDHPAFSQTVRFTVGPDAGSPELIEAARSATAPEKAASSSTSNLWIWIIVAAGVVVILLMGFFLARRKK